MHARERTIRVIGPGSEVQRFVISGEDGYSHFWRRDTSPVEPLELAKVLQAMRKIASFVGRNVGQVVWAGMEVEDAVALDPAPILGAYPVPAKKLDLMAGLTIEEAYKCTEWSERIFRLAKEKVSLPPHYEYKFNIFLSLCEDVYVDCLANRSVLGRYTETARKWRIAENARRLLSPPTVSEALHLWWDLAADRDPQRYLGGYHDDTMEGILNTQSLEKYYKQPIEVLNSIVKDLRAAADVPGLAERCEFRLELYLAVWPSFLELVKFWPGDRSDRFLVPDVCDEDVARDDEERKAVKATISSYAELIDRALPRRNRDFTEELRDSVADGERVVPIEGNDIVMVAPDQIDSKLLHRLEQVVRSAAQWRNTYNRGLTAGKLSRSRLHRAPTTGTVFQERKTEFELRDDIILLVDATGSMADPAKWQKAEVLWQTLFTAIKGHNKKARIFAYNEVKQTCRITELYRGGRLLTVLPHGKTASGEAIMATEISTRGHGKRRLIMHVTDGASNWGCGVDEALHHCRRHGVSLLTLGIGCGASAKQSLKEEYGKQVQFVDDMAALPELVGMLLKRRLG